MLPSENGDMKQQRDYWFLLANEQIDFIDWLVDTHLPGYDLQELNSEYEKHLDNEAKTTQQ